MKYLALFAMALAGCGHLPGNRAVPPKASTEAVGVNLDELEASLGQARGSVRSLKGSLSESDAKAVRIQEAIRNW